jgi:hypothetical protein
MMGFIRDAGFGIYPVLLFGMIGSIVAVRHAIAPSKDRQALLAGVAIATVLLGILGTVTGLQASASHIGEVAEPVKIFLFGMAESLNNLVAALVFVTVHALLGTFGAYRHARVAKATA